VIVPVSTARAASLFAAALLMAWSTVNAGAQAPAAPSNPTPLDGATGVAVAGPLTWNSLPMALSYDLRLGTSPSALRFSADRIAPQPMTVTIISGLPGP